MANVQYKRSRRVGELIMQEISTMLIHKEIKDPRIGFVSVTHIACSDDLRTAKVFVSIINNDEKEPTLEALNCASGYVRGLLGKRVSLKYIPQLDFKLDESLEHSMKINKIIEELKRED